MKFEDDGEVDDKIVVSTLPIIDDDQYCITRDDIPAISEAA